MNYDCISCSIATSQFTAPPKSLRVVRREHGWRYPVVQVELRAGVYAQVVAGKAAPGALLFLLPQHRQGAPKMARAVRCLQARSQLDGLLRTLVADLGRYLPAHIRRRCARPFRVREYVHPGELQAL